MIPARYVTQQRAGRQANWLPGLQQFKRASYRRQGWTKPPTAENIEYCLDSFGAYANPKGIIRRAANFANETESGLINKLAEKNFLGSTFWVCSVPEVPSWNLDPAGVAVPTSVVSRQDSTKRLLIIKNRLRQPHPEF